MKTVPSVSTLTKQFLTRAQDISRWRLKIRKMTLRNTTISFPGATARRSYQWSQSKIARASQWTSTAIIIRKKHGNEDVMTSALCKYALNMCNKNALLALGTQWHGNYRFVTKLWCYHCVSVCKLFRLFINGVLAIEQNLKSPSFWRRLGYFV